MAATLPFSCSCLFSSCLRKWGNSVLNAAFHPRDQLWDSSPALLWEVGLLPHPILSLCASPDPWVLVAPLGGWLVAPSLFSVFAVFPVFLHWEFGSWPHPCSPEQFSIPLPPPLSVLDYSLLFMFFSFSGEGVQSAQGLHWIIFLGELCMMLTWSFCSVTQAALELAGGEKLCCFSQCSMA
jgi:hypothetical protein